MINDLHIQKKQSHHNKTPKDFTYLYQGLDCLCDWIYWGVNELAFYSLTELLQRWPSLVIASICVRSSHLWKTPQLQVQSNFKFRKRAQIFAKTFVGSAHDIHLCSHLPLKSLLCEMVKQREHGYESNVNAGVHPLFTSL